MKNTAPRALPLTADMDGTLHPKYPTINLLVKIGRPMAMVVAVLMVVLGVGAFVAGHGFAWGLTGVIGGLASFVVLRACVDVLEVISDILLPR